MSPLAAQAFGARNPHRVRRSLRVGLWAAFLISLPVMALPFWGERILLALGQSPGAAALAQQYLLGLVWSILPGLWFMAIRGFMSAINRPRADIVDHARGHSDQCAAGLSAALRRMGISAAGIVRRRTCHFSWSIRRCSSRPSGLPPARWLFRKYHVLGRIWRIDWPLMRQLVILGAPISISFLLEYGLFGAAGLLMGLISTTALAAHQIALQIAAILFMVPYGIGMAATVRVGHGVGRRDAAAVRRAGFIATGLGIGFMSAMTLVVILGRFAIAQIFLGQGADAAAELTATLLLVGATFFIADGIQTIASGSLRGMNDTRVPLLFATVSYWLIGFTLACGLGFRTPLGAVGVWIGLSCGTVVYATLLLLRFRLLASRL